MKLNGQMYKLPNQVEIRLPEIRLLKENEETGEWEETNDHLYIDGYLFNNLYMIRQYAKKYNGDILYVVDGEEGSGKSTIARQVAIVLDNKFDHKKICYSTQDAIQMHKTNGKWSSLCLDESKEDLDRKSTMSKNNKHFMNFLSQSRQENKFLAVVLPSIFDLDKYVAEHRARFLIHCYKHRGRNPGYFKFYGKNGIKKLFLYGQKTREYNVTPGFTGRFLKHEVVDLKEYDKRKRGAIQKYYRMVEEEMNRSEADIIKNYILERIEDLDNIKDNHKFTVHALCAILGISTSSLYRYKEEIQERKKSYS